MVHRGTLVGGALSPLVPMTFGLNHASGWDAPPLLVRGSCRFGDQGPSSVGLCLAPGGPRNLGNGPRAGGGLRMLVAPPCQGENITSDLMCPTGCLGLDESALGRGQYWGYPGMVPARAVLVVPSMSGGA